MFCISGLNEQLVNVHSRSSSGCKCTFLKMIPNLCHQKEMENNQPTKKHFIVKPIMTSVFITSSPSLCLHLDPSQWRQTISEIKMYRRTALNCNRYVLKVWRCSSLVPTVGTTLTTATLVTNLTTATLVTNITTTTIVTTYIT